MSPIACVVECIRHGGWLSVKDGKIDLRKPRDFPEHLLADLSANRDAIIELLTNELIIVESKLDPGQPLIWCKSEDVRSLLIEHGASPGKIWTREELATVARSVRSPEQATLLLKARRLFDAQVGDHQAGGEVNRTQ